MSPDDDDENACLNCGQELTEENEERECVFCGEEGCSKCIKICVLCENPFCADCGDEDVCMDCADEDEEDD